VRDAALGEKLPDSADTLPNVGRGSPDYRIPGRADPIRARYVVASPSYFSTLRIPLLRGRVLNEQDRKRVVISESMARLGWSDSNPIGQQIEAYGEALEVVGVVGDVQGLVTNAQGERRLLQRTAVYRSMFDAAPATPQFFLAVRTTGDPLNAGRSIREAVRAAGGVVAEMDTMERFVENATWQNEQAAPLLGAFAALALILSGVGLYGVISFAVARRTREIGIRVAIGADPAKVIGLVLGESAGPVIAGAAIGLAGALASGRVMQTLLYGVAPSDPGVLAAVAGAIGVAALFACLDPVRRALQIDPASALRVD
jgi:hypothetical protein